MEEDNRAFRKDCRIQFRINPVNTKQEMEFGKGVVLFYYAFQILELQIKNCFTICFSQNQKMSSKA